MKRPPFLSQLTPHWSGPRTNGELRGSIVFNRLKPLRPLNFNVHLPQEVTRDMGSLPAMLLISGREVTQVKFDQVYWAKSNSKLNKNQQLLYCTLQWHFLALVQLCVRMQTKPVIRHFHKRFSLVATCIINIELRAVVYDHYLQVFMKVFIQGTPHTVHLIFKSLLWTLTWPHRHELKFNMWHQGYTRRI